MHVKLIPCILVALAACFSRAGAFIPPPPIVGGPPSVQVVAAEIAQDWEIIVEGEVITYELTSIPTASSQLWCSLVTIRVDKSIAGGPASQIQAVTTGFPDGQPPPKTGVTSFASYQVPLPPIHARGLFLLKRAGQQEGWARRPSRIVFLSGPGAWIPQASSNELVVPRWGPIACSYDRLVRELESAVAARSFDALVAGASFIARVRLDHVKAHVSREDSIQSTRYSVEVIDVYRGALGKGPVNVLFEEGPSRTGENQIGVNSFLMRGLMQKLQLSQGREALIYGDVVSPSDVMLLPAGIMAIEGSSVEMGVVRSSGDSASVFQKPLNELEPRLR